MIMFLLKLYLNYESKIPKAKEMQDHKQYKILKKIQDNELSLSSIQFKYCF